MFRDPDNNPGAALSSRLPPGQEWFLSRWQNAGYVETETSKLIGHCAGVAYSGRDALLTQPGKFRAQFFQMHEIPPEQFKKTLDAVQAKWVAILAKAKQALPPLTHLSQEQIEQLRKEKLTKKERGQLELSAFISRAVIYHIPMKFSYLLEQKNVTQQDNPAIGHLLESVGLAQSGGTIKIAEFSGMYSKKDLQKCFELLREKLELIARFQAVRAKSQGEPSRPILPAIVLVSATHAITIGYDAKNKQWIWINANELSKEYVADTKTLADEILAAFFCQDKVAFCTKIYTTNKNSNPTRAQVMACLQQEEWKQLHSITSQKAGMIDSTGAGWLYIAAENGHMDIVHSLLEHQADINKGRSDNGTTPLFIAAQNGHAKVVRLLLEYQADPNTTRTNDGTTLLFIAAQNGHAEVVRLLLEHLEHPNKARSDNGATPLFIAAQEGQSDVIEVLLSAKNIDVEKSLRTNVSSLRDFAKGCQKVSAFEIFIQARLMQDPAATQLFITPCEIAALMGHHAIAEKLEQHTQSLQSARAFSP